MHTTYPSLLTPHFNPLWWLCLSVSLQGRLGETKSHRLHFASRCCAICSCPSLQWRSEWGNISWWECILQKWDVAPRDSSYAEGRDSTFQVFSFSVADLARLGDGWEYLLPFRSFFHGLWAFFFLHPPTTPLGFFKSNCSNSLLFLIFSALPKIFRPLNKNIARIREQVYIFSLFLFFKFYFYHF